MSRASRSPFVALAAVLLMAVLASCAERTAGEPADVAGPGDTGLAAESWSAPEAAGPLAPVAGLDTAAAAGQGGFLVVREQHDGGLLAVAVATALPDGTLGGFEPIGAGPRTGTHPAVAWDGEAYLVAWTGFRADGSTGIRARFVGPDGHAVGAELDVGPEGDTAYPALAHADGAFRFAWGADGADGWHVRTRLLDADGAAAGPDVEVATARNGLAAVAITAETDGLMVAWQAKAADGGLAIGARRLGTDGMPSGDAVDLGGRPDGRGSLAAVHAGAAHHVTWNGADEDGVRRTGSMILDGDVVDDGFADLLPPDAAVDARVGLALDLAGRVLATWTRTDRNGDALTQAALLTLGTLPNGASCQQSSDCTSGYCVDGVCCASSCGNGVTTDCRACSVAAGSSADGTCAMIAAAANYVCRPASGDCDVAEKCSGTSTACPTNRFMSSTTVCRAVAGPCDKADRCTGSSATCPADGFLASGTVCNASTGPCDPAEKCTGSSAACPTPVLAPQGTVCRAATGVCDASEVCDGQTAACPANGYLPATTVCRVSAGPCDKQETCTGSSASCPGDSFLPSTTVCRTAAGPCDKQEKCTGASAACPADTFLVAGTVCHASTGPCDPAETCSGSGAECPPDSMAGAGTVCRAATGPCDVAETCDGQTGACPANAWMPSGTECRPATGACDRAEKCTGSSGACPADAVLANGTTCRASTGPCDPAEKCDGVSKECAADALTPQGTQCRASAGPCDPAEACDGTTGACPANALSPAGTECRSAAGPCDKVETCTGSSAACPTDAKLAAGTLCRPAADVCDKAEACTGASIDCPADAKVAAGTTCRTSTGPCDPAETCDGASDSCPADALASPGTVCRTAAGPCDVEENCTGTSGACPANAYRPAGFECRAAEGPCDRAEACNGASAACPADRVYSAGTSCRPSTGACDPAEVCDGSLKTCPADVLLAAGVQCRASAGACDPAEVCDGVSGACHANALSPAGTVCRAAVDVCDREETCTGASAACPSDGYLASGTLCRASVGPCDRPETCTGSAAACPADSVLSASTVCRASAGTCDPAERCDGVGPMCPPDALAEAGTTCRPSAGICDVAEACTGASASCPVNAWMPAGTVCRAAAGACDRPETCSGSSATCPGDVLYASGTVCRMAAGACDLTETCTGASPLCPDDLVKASGTSCRAPAYPCDATESCDGATAACPEDAAIPDGSACSDGSACTVGDTCLGGVCTATQIDCDDGETCTVDWCDPATGCVNQPRSGGCDDGDPCTEIDLCLDGTCRGTQPRMCGAPDTCHLAGACDHATGECVNPPAPDGSWCDDGNPCTIEDACAGGACVAEAEPCDDGNPCTTDTCDGAMALCVNTPIPGCCAPQCAGRECGPDGCGGSCGSCEAGMECGGTGLCVPSAPTCASAADCVLACGGFVPPCLAMCTQGLSGNDMNLLSALANCVTPRCGVLPEPACYEDAITGPCRTQHDVCYGIPCVPDCAGRECGSDGCNGSCGACDAGFSCVNGQCEPELATCPDLADCFRACTEENWTPCVNACWSRGTPDAVATWQAVADCVVQHCGPNPQPSCAWPAIDNECSGPYGLCDCGADADCDDSSTCTADSCDEPTRVCLHEPANEGASCDDANLCTTDDACAGGRCTGAAVQCPGGDACTKYECEPATGECVAVPVSCNDGNPCTDDFCDTDTGACVFEPIPGCCNPTCLNPDGSPRACGSDGCGGTCGSCPPTQTCTSEGTCVWSGDCGSVPWEGCCEGNQLRYCDHGHLVNATCDAIPACGWNPGTGFYDCGTAGEPDPSGSFAMACSACVPSCMGRECGPDGCGGSCGTCAAPQVCTTAGTCVDGGGCDPSACNDGNPCTVDTCNAATGACEFAPADGVPCSDGDPCTTGDMCVAGACGAGDPISGCTDDDHDGIPDDVDNCPGVSNPEQADLDGDGQGDACDCDADGDGIANPSMVCAPCDPCDNCPWVANPGQEDSNQDGVGDACECVPDCEGMECGDDGCGGSCGTCAAPQVCTTAGTCVDGGGCDPAACNDSNPCTVDTCNPATGACEFAPSDGVPCSDGNECTLGDACQAGACAPGPQADCSDGDICTYDECDAVVGCVNPPRCVDTYVCTTDSCNDATGECTYEWIPGCTDDDQDGVADQQDNCPGAPNPDQSDMDGDGQGDACDCDIDGDGVLNDNLGCAPCDPCDNCPWAANAGQEDTDGDGVGDACQCVPSCAGRMCGDDGCGGSCGTCAAPQVCTTAGTCVDGGGGGGLTCSGINACMAGCDSADQECLDDCLAQGAPDAQQLYNDLLACVGDCPDDACVQERIEGVCKPLFEACFGGSGGCEPPGCDDMNPCTSDTCNAPTGTCQHMPADGAACDDANVCTTGDTCMAGGCVGQATMSCDDADPCTDDSCDPLKGCFNAPRCHDGDPCTTDSCDPASGECANDPIEGCTDDDQDGVADQQDNCLGVPNPDQKDLDEDGQGDACDCDIDGDGVPNGSPNTVVACPPCGDVAIGEPPCDNCPYAVNPDQTDSDGDGTGDACECVPSCVGPGGLRECGDDGCGGSCGTCPAGSTCVDDGKRRWCEGGGGGTSPCGELMDCVIGCGMDPGCSQPCFDSAPTSAFPAYVSLMGCVVSQCARVFPLPCWDMAIQGPCQPQWNQCNGGSTGGCQTDADCPAGFLCQVSTGQCIAAGCQGDWECPAGEVCIGGTCMPGQVDNDHDGWPASMDCDDNDPEVHPGAQEKCNGIDDDCNGIADELPTQWYTCGTGECASQGMRNCVGGAWMENCTPRSPVPEVCDARDNDCDGVVDNDACPCDTAEDCLAQACRDASCDAGFCAWTLSPDGTPCSDLSACSGPDACQGGHCIGMQLDCDDGLACTNDYCDPMDQTGDPCRHFSLTCFDSDGCTTDACEEPGGCVFTPIPGCMDSDHDGWRDEEDCAPFDPTINPGAREMCNGRDDDCDGTTDNGLAQPTSCGMGACSATGTMDCVDGSWQEFCQPGTPGVEDCNGIDDDCDGMADEGLDGWTWCGLGACRSQGPRHCMGGTWIDVCSPGAPSPEACDGVDNDCDGETDEGVCPCQDAGECIARACQDAACVAGFCAWTNQADGFGCDDGNPCTLFDACLAGACQGAARDCEDGLACTVDYCDTGNGGDPCVHMARACDDANVCSTDSCAEPDGCVFTPIPGCMDSDHDGWRDEEDCEPYNPMVNPGRAEQCDSFDNDCNGVTDDGDLCPSPDPCKTGSCVAGACMYVPATDGTPCWGNGTCQAGACMPLPPAPAWRIDPWGPCSVPCGAGVMFRPVLCVDWQGTVVDDAVCLAYAPKPESSMECNPSACSWTVGSWGECPVECGGGIRTRPVVCWAPDLGQGVEAAYCLDLMPPESEPCNLETTRPCPYSGPPETLWVGVCHAGERVCEGGFWSQCFGEVVPTDETCNGMDDDCDGVIDEDC